ncbi:MAG: hypothetical protein GY772_10710 [bacterium]|jgi:hypothetical protein|nr:hypothetical protein [bacterium]|tara:strand:- start:145 stop:309 length:165 start_codon:yes stop_codon:yes gene_type:complete
MPGGACCSTFDLIALDAFSLITTERSEAWEVAVAALPGVPVRCVPIDRVRQWMK